MAFYQFTRQQRIQALPEDLWRFIATPSNLSKITPASMGFEILSPNLPDLMYEGMIIHYRVRPLPFYTTEWVTEITHIKPGEYFVDEQRVGPYKMWHHQHLLQADADGVQMTDIVSYQLPLGAIGTLGNHLLVKHRLKQIFDFREKALAQCFAQPYALIT